MPMFSVYESLSADDFSPEDLICCIWVRQTNRKVYVLVRVNTLFEATQRVQLFCRLMGAEIDKGPARFAAWYLSPELQTAFTPSSKPGPAAARDGREEFITGEKSNGI